MSRHSEDDLPTDPAAPARVNANDDMAFHSQRATRAEIDTDAFLHNMRQVRACLRPGVLVMAVLKANAYGHGALSLAPLAVRAGADWLAVACVDEGIDIRRVVGNRIPILVLGPSDPGEFESAIAARLALAIGSVPMARALDDVAARLGTTVDVHLKVDSGMSRYGILPDDAITAFDDLMSFYHLHVQGVFTHFASAEEVGAPTNRRQLHELFAVRQAALQRGHTDLLFHAANSAATFGYPDSHLNMVRVGIALYGYSPFALAAHALLPAGARELVTALRPVLHLRSRLMRVWQVRVGDGVSYGHLWRASRPTWVGLVPIGYADGLPRTLTGTGAALLVDGHRTPILGRICMDQCVVDLSALPVLPPVGTDVVVLGSSGNLTQTADHIGALIGTNSYETICRIALRVPRHYV